MLHKFPDKIVKTKFFFAFQDEKKSIWLTRMGLDGWHLSSVEDNNKYYFKKSEPADNVYIIDCQPDKKDDINYINNIESKGFELVSSHLGTLYWRKPYNENSNFYIDFIYSQKISELSESASTISSSMLLCLMPIIISLIFIFFVAVPKNDFSGLAVIFLIILSASIALMIYLAVVYFKLNKNILNLKNKK